MRLSVLSRFLFIFKIFFLPSECIQGFESLRSFALVVEVRLIGHWLPRGWGTKILKSQQQQQQHWIDITYMYDDISMV